MLFDDNQLQRHYHYLNLALEQAQLAADKQEVPVGAVICDLSAQPIASAHNLTLSACDPCAHAEILAIRAAAASLGRSRLPDCCLYVTLEPCIMCCGAIIQARLAEVIYCLDEPKTGACCNEPSHLLGLNLTQKPFNHHTRFIKLSDFPNTSSAQKLLKTFFQDRR